MNAIDTNLLVYALDSTQGERHRKATRLLQKLLEGKEPVMISLQALGEFFWVCTRKARKKIDPQKLTGVIESLAHHQNVHLVQYQLKELLQATEKNTAFWDALMAVTYVNNGATKLLTENTKDFNNQGIKVVNPLK